ncbi:hypothetical protein SAMN05192574_105325 [Mucilaginibacter gossypiicola]|uniref:Pimeloyl-ACP methyl ester carboxylesterase n=2 Tax=Mucilaginibacter gossypiicola TaxID=551995 RepID=A0A1H8LZV7_9SPHI|nr:hypothetical protein SAMN05192574_105325 [Mucilaginibacter gossypiicola]
MAGIILPSFIRLYPQEVKGIVFVDCSHPLQVKRFAGYPELTIKAPAQWQAKLMGDFGLLRLFYHDRYPSIAINDSINIAAQDFIPEAAAGVIDEANAFNSMADSAALIRNFGDIPLVVLTGTAAKRISDLQNPETGKAFMRIWLELQNDHLHRSTNSKQIMATRSGHYIQLDQPELVVDAIRGLVN